MIGSLLKHIGDIIVGLAQRDEIWFVLFLIGFAGFFLIVPLSNISIIGAIALFFEYTWWVWIFLIIWKLFFSTWIYWRQEIFQREDLKWFMWEIQIPRSNEKGPEAMEAVINAIYGQRNAATDPKETYWDGEVTRWFALEMVSLGGEVHFYLRGYYKTRNLTEAAFHAHYPDLELIPTEDYIHRFPQSLAEIYAQQKDVWGSDMVLKKEPYIPIRTYKHFLNDPGEEKRVDPMGAFLEVLSKLKSTELVGIQILLQATGDAWTENAKAKIQKFKEETGSRNTVQTDEGNQTTISVRTPGETEALKEMEGNIGKVAFETVIRFIYISPQEGFYDSYARRGIRTAFNQYSDVSRNGFALNEPMSTRAKIWYFPFVFPRLRVEFRKQRLIYNYFNRELPKDTFMGKILTSHFLNLNFPMQTFILTAEGIASIFHPPTDIVLTTPHIPRQESRRAGPQSGLQIFGEEEDIEKYQ